MRLLLDECCDRLLVAALREAGHDVSSVAEVSPGATDDEVVVLASDEGRVLVTYDYDFGELTVRRGLPVPGVVLIACGTLAPGDRASRAVAALGSLPDEGGGWLTVVEPRRVRRRLL